MSLGLLHERSTYFDKLFGGGYIEGQQGDVVLSDVEPAVFRVLFGWLCTQPMFYEAIRACTKEVTELSTKARDLTAVEFVRYRRRKGEEGSNSVDVSAGVALVPSSSVAPSYSES